MRVWKRIVAGAGITALAIAGLVGVVVIVGMVELVRVLAPTVSYNHYARSVLHTIGDKVLIYPGSKVLEDKQVNPNPFDQYEVESVFLELPKQTTYQDYLVWLFENTGPNGRWTIPGHQQESFSQGNLATYPDEEFQDEQDGAMIRVDTRFGALPNQPFAKHFTVRQRGVSHDGLQSPYTVYQGQDGGIVLHVQLTIDTRRQGQPPAQSIEQIFAKIPGE